MQKLQHFHHEVKALYSIAQNRGGKYFDKWNTTCIPTYCNMGLKRFSCQ